MKKIITTILLLISVADISQNKQDPTWKARLNNLEYKLNDIEKRNYENEITTLKDKFDFQQKISEQSVSSILSYPEIG